MLPWQWLNWGFSQQGYTPKVCVVESLAFLPLPGSQGWNWAARHLHQAPFLTSHSSPEAFVEDFYISLFPLIIGMKACLCLETGMKRYLAPVVVFLGPVLLGFSM